MRYKVEMASQHQCCFDASVVDTEPTDPEEKGFLGDQYPTVCECFDQKTAQMIADALNVAFTDGGARSVS
jgi:hypothetical protein